MRILTLGVLAGAVAVSALAQYSEIPESALRPMLISDTKVQPDDSPLVRAAKMNVARRQKAGKVMVVDVTKIGTTDSRGAQLPQFEGPNEVEGPIPTDATAATKVALQQKATVLKQEQEQISHEADQPYAGDIEEDRVQQRVEQIPAETDQTNRDLQQLQQPPAPPRP